MNLVVAVLAWLAAGYRLGILLRHRTYLHAMYASIFVLIAAAFTAKLLEPRFNAALGPYTGDLIKHLLVVTMGAVTQLYILAVDRPRPTMPRVLVRVGLAVVVGSALIAMFSAAAIHDAQTTQELADVPMPEVLAYRLIFNGYLSYVLLDNIRLYRRFAGASGDEGRLINLRMIGWGSGIGLLYCASRLISILATAVTGHPLTVLEAVGSAAAVVGVACVALAVFTPRLVPWLVDWRCARRGIRRMQALWSDLTSTYPAVVLRPRTSFGSHRAEFVYDRRLIETSECLRLARLPESAATTVTVASEPLFELARQLKLGRDDWTSNTGPPAADLLPQAQNRAEETAVLLSLADAYAELIPLRVSSPSITAP